MGILDLIFPKYCLSCQKPGKYICSNCLGKVPKSGYIRGNVALWKYEGVIRKAIISLKYKFAFNVAEELAELAVTELRSRPGFFGKNFLVTSVPLTRSRENWRGFNQAEVLARLIASKLNKPVNFNLVRRVGQGLQQVGLNKEQRIRNIRGNFAVNSEAREIFKTHKAIVIVDDVVTTGSTMGEMVKVLKKAGAREVWGLAIAR